MRHTLLLYILLICVKSQCERSQVLCSDILYTGTVWGDANSKGILIGAYTNDELQFIGTEGSQSSSTFYCNHPTPSSMQFGNTGTVRSLLGPGAISSSTGGCCGSSNQRGLCNAPDEATSAAKLCRQLGYNQGTVTRVSSNSCPETHWDGSKWTSDWVGTAGYGGTFTCSNACTTEPTKTPSKTPSYSPSKNPSNMPTLFPSKTPSYSPSKNPTNTPTLTPSNNPSKTPTKVPTVSSNNPSKSPTIRPTNIPSITPSSQPSTSPTLQPTKNPTPAPVEEGNIDGNDEILTTSEKETQNQDGYKSGIGNDTEINWTDMHHVMFYIIISFLLCIIIVISFVFTVIRKKDKRKYDALKRVSVLSPSSTNNLNYDRLGAHSPRHTEMTSITDIGNMQAMWTASNVMPVISAPLPIINTGDLLPENIAIADDDDDENNNVENVHVVNKTHDVHEGDETNESDEEDDIGLYDGMAVTPINPNNDFTPQ